MGMVEKWVLMEDLIEDVRKLLGKMQEYYDRLEPVTKPRWQEKYKLQQAKMAEILAELEKLKAEIEPFQIL